MPNESLNDIIAKIGPDASAKLIEVSGQVSVVAGQRLGFELTVDEIIELEVVKLVVMTDDYGLNIEDAISQLRAVPSVAAKPAAKKTAEEVQKGHTDLLKGMTPIQKMN